MAGQGGRTRHVLTHPCDSKSDPAAADLDPPPAAVDSAADTGEEAL